MASRSTVSRGLCILVPLLLAGGPAFAQAPATRPAGPLPAVTRVPEYAGTSHVPERLLREKSPEAIVVPSEPSEYCEEPSRRSGTVIAKLPPELKPLPDGYAIGRRPGRIEQQDNAYVVHLERVPRLPDTPPLRVLPNSRLALLESVLAESGGDHRFLITGRITEFQGLNYILLDHLSELITREDENPSPPGPETPAAEATPSTRPAGETETRPASHEPTAEELIRQLMRDKPTRPLVFPEEAGVPATAPAGVTEQRLPEPPDSERAHWRDETLLSDRMARLVPGECGGAWMLAFEDRGRNPLDGPVRVLPGRLLEMALNLTAGGTKSVVLVVSGEVTAYRGANYILLRKVLVKKDLGNFR